MLGDGHVRQSDGLEAYPCSWYVLTPPPPSQKHNTPPPNPLVDSLAASAKREGGVAPARRTRLGCVLRVESPLSAHGSGAPSSGAAEAWVDMCDPAMLPPPLAVVALLVGGEVWGVKTLQERRKEGGGAPSLQILGLSSPRLVVGHPVPHQ